MSTRRKSATGRFATLFATLGMLLLSSGVALTVMATPAQAADTCPDENDGWIKIDGVDALEKTIEAPADMLIAEVCAKSSDNLVQVTLDPPVASFTFNSGVAPFDVFVNDQGEFQNISHVSYRLVPVDEPPVEEPPVEEPPVEEPPVVEPPVVEPPVVEPPTVKTPVTTPTVVSAGLGDLAGDASGAQGVALIAAGMVMVLVAGGLGLLRAQSQRARI